MVRGGPHFAFGSAFTVANEPDDSSKLQGNPRPRPDSSAAGFLQTARIVRGVPASRVCSVVCRGMLFARLEGKPQCVILM